MNDSSESQDAKKEPSDTDSNGTIERIINLIMFIPELFFGMFALLLAILALAFNQPDLAQNLTEAATACGFASAFLDLIRRAILNVYLPATNGKE